MYEGFYESNIDTPYIGKDIYQYTVHAALDVMVKDKYPLRVYFTTRFSNSSFLKNITDLNFQFNNQGFRNTIKQNVERWNNQQLPQMQNLNKLASQIDAKKNELSGLQGWLSSPSLLQQLVEDKEREMVQNKRGGKKAPAAVNYNDSLTTTELNEIKNWKSNQRHFTTDDAIGLFKGFRPKQKKNRNDSAIAKINKVDSSYKTLGTSIAEKKKRCDTLIQQIALLDQQYKEAKTRAGGSKDSLINIITHVKDPAVLASALHSMNLPDSVLPRGYKTLLALQSMGVGRSIVNYSELSVKNISINGIQAEYNPSYYCAFAAGTIDYRFRDFIINDQPRQKQYISVVRFGKGPKEGNHLIATYYTGRKQLYNYSTDSAGSTAPNPSRYNLMGVSLESRYQINNSTYVVAEVAKSSLPYYNRQQNKQNLFASTFSFKDRSNEAYSIKLVSYIPASATRINAYYKHFGANFQSFSQFTTSSTQDAWYVRVEQPFFKKKLDVAASIRKNDFTNPYINQGFYNNTVFKSLQASIRFKKMPVISIGYYPSSQLTKLGNDQYVENLFYTLVGTASYFYRYHSVMMNSLVSYTQFYNKATDSSFVYFNTRNLLLGQGFFFQKFTLQFNISAAQNNAYNLYTADGSIQYKLRSWLTVGGGLKYNRQTVIDNRQLGYSANAKVKIRGFGDVEFLAQKGFIPGINKQLVENDIGRLIYYRTF